MRLVTLLLIVTLIGPSVGGLVCDWTCASAHQAAAAAETNCHDAPGPAQMATLAAGHECHELPTMAVAIADCAPQVVPPPATVETATHVTVMVRAPFTTRRPDRSHAPPSTNITPLRI